MKTCLGLPLGENDRWQLKGNTAAMNGLCLFSLRMISMMMTMVMTIKRVNICDFVPNSTLDYVYMKTVYRPALWGPHWLSSLFIFDAVAIMSFKKINGLIKNTGLRFDNPVSLFNKVSSSYELVLFMQILCYTSCKKFH